MVHDHADLTATGRLVHIPVPVGKGSAVEAIGEGYHQTSKPLFSHQITPRRELKILLQNTTQKKEGTEVLPVTAATGFLIGTVSHLTFATTSLQEGRNILPYDFCKVSMRKRS